MYYSFRVDYRNNFIIIQTTFRADYRNNFMIIQAAFGVDTVIIF